MTSPPAHDIVTPPSCEKTAGAVRDGRRRRKRIAQLDEATALRHLGMTGQYHRATGTHSGYATRNMELDLGGPDDASGPAARGGWGWARRTARGRRQGPETFAAAGVVGGAQGDPCVKNA